MAKYFEQSCGIGAEILFSLATLCCVGRVAPPEVGELSESEVGLVNSLTVIVYFVDSTE